MVGSSRWESGQLFTVTQLYPWEINTLILQGSLKIDCCLYLTWFVFVLPEDLVFENGSTVALIGLWVTLRCWWLIWIVMWHMEKFYNLQFISDIWHKSCCYVLPDEKIILVLLFKEARWSMRPIKCKSNHITGLITFYHAKIPVYVPNISHELYNLFPE